MDLFYQTYFHLYDSGGSNSLLHDQPKIQKYISAKHEDWRYYCLGADHRRGVVRDQEGN